MVQYPGQFTMHLPDEQQYLPNGNTGLNSSGGTASGVSATETPPHQYQYPPMYSPGGPQALLAQQQQWAQAQAQAQQQQQQQQQRQQHQQRMYAMSHSHGQQQSSPQHQAASNMFLPSTPPYLRAQPYPNTPNLPPFYQTARGSVARSRQYNIATSMNMSAGNQSPPYTPPQSLMAGLPQTHHMVTMSPNSQIEDLTEPEHLLQQQYTQDQLAQTRARQRNAAMQQRQAQRRRATQERAQEQQRQVAQERAQEQQRLEVQEQAQERQRQVIQQQASRLQGTMFASSNVALVTLQSPPMSRQVDSPSPRLPRTSSATPRMNPQPYNTLLGNSTQQRNNSAMSPSDTPSRGRQRLMESAMMQGTRRPAADDQYDHESIATRQATAASNIPQGPSTASRLEQLRAIRFQSTQALMAQQEAERQAKIRKGNEERENEREKHRKEAEERRARKRKAQEAYQRELDRRAEQQRIAARKDALTKDESALYRYYNEYLKIFPLEDGDCRNKYLSCLLANQVIPSDKDSDRAIAIAFAKEHWDWYMVCPKDNESALKAAKKATNENWKAWLK